MEVLPCKRERGNRHDPFAVSVIKSGIGIVGHLPRNISSICLIFLRRGGLISSTVTGSRRYYRDLSQVGVEIPCLLKFVGSEKETKKAEKLVQSVLNLPKVGSNLEINIQQPAAEERNVEEMNASEPIEQPPLVMMSPPSKKHKFAKDWEDIIMGRKLTDEHINFA